MLRFHNIFKSQGRLFKVNGITHDKELADVWQIVEVVERKYGETVFYDPIAAGFERGKKEMEQALKEGRIEII